MRFPGAEIPFGARPDGAASFFEPLNVCDDGSDVNGFLSDCPWLFGAGEAREEPQACTACAPFIPARLTEGFLSLPFRPPRSATLS